MISGVADATSGSTVSGIAAVTNPAPTRNADQEAKTAAPLLPSEPATMSAWP